MLTLCPYAQLERILGGLPAKGNLTVAITCWAVHDSFITLPQEIEFVWSRRMTFPRVMFGLLRVTGIAILCTLVYLTTRPLSDAGCKIYTFLTLYNNVALALPQDALLLWRVWVLFQGRTRIKIALLLLNCVVWMALAGGITYGTATSPLVILHLDTVCGCWPMPHPNEPSALLSLLLLTAGLSNLSFQVILILLTIFNPHTMGKKGKALLMPILWALRKQLTIYSVVWLVMLTLSTTINFSFPGRPLAGLGNPILIGCQTIGNCRLYLHLKSRPWSDMSTDEFSTHVRTPGETSPIIIPSASTTWSSALSAQAVPNPARNRGLGRDEEDEPDAVNQRAARTVIASLEEE